MINGTPPPRWRFWQVFGLATAMALAITLLFTAFGSGFNTEKWSNALCLSALALGVASTIPVILDVGRGFLLIGRITESKEEQKEALERDHTQRNTGIMFTFALALAALLLMFLSLVVSLH